MSEENNQNVDKKQLANKLKPPEEGGLGQVGKKEGQQWTALQLQLWSFPAGGGRFAST